MDEIRKGIERGVALAQGFGQSLTIEQTYSWCIEYGVRLGQERMRERAIEIVDVVDPHLPDDEQRAEIVNDIRALPIEGDE